MNKPHYFVRAIAAALALSTLSLLTATAARSEEAEAKTTGTSVEENTNAGSEAGEKATESVTHETPVTDPGNGEESQPAAAAGGEAGESATPTGEAAPAGDAASGDDEEVIEEVEPEVVPEEGFFPSAFDGDAAVRRDRGVNVLTARPVRKRALVLFIDHRPYQTLFSKDAFHDYLGFDSGNLKVGIGLRYGILDALDVGFSRLSDGRTVAYDTYEFNARYAFLRQERHYVDAALLAGVTWFSQKDHKDAAGGFAQLFVDHVFFDMLLVGVGFGFHSDSSSDEKAVDDEAFSGAVLGLIEWRMIRQLAFTAEVAANVFGYDQKWPVLSFAVKVLTNRHVFSLILTNTQFILSDGIVADAWRGPSDWVFGFQITREFDF
jgi:hypothetical protein